MSRKYPDFTANRGGSEGPDSSEFSAIPTANFLFHCKIGVIPTSLSFPHCVHFHTNSNVRQIWSGIKFDSAPLHFPHHPHLEGGFDPLSMFESN